ncbi:MAG: hypothetical protein B0D91_08770 [Oceanospirillales bacterium LUC14_002_19_P2]|nr:MAG: hypothetical protein B0D91_08770 [Oceanospirillales bacterium LUC14_002_19_P2]
MADYIPDSSNLILEGSHDYSAPDGANISPDVAFGELLQPPPVSWPVVPSITRQWQVRWEPAVDKQQDTDIGWRPADQTESFVQLRQCVASKKLEPELHSLWGRIPCKETDSVLAWAHGHRCESVAIGFWGDVPAKDAVPTCAGWDDSVTANEISSGIWWGNPPGKDKRHGDGWYRVQEHLSGEIEPKTYIPEPARLAFVFQGTRYTPAHNESIWFTFGSTVTSKASRPRNSSILSQWILAKQYNPAWQLPWGAGQSQQRRDADYSIRFVANIDPVDPTDPTDPTDPSTPERPADKDTWLIMNTISVVTLLDQQPLDVTELAIELDIDSFTWQLSAQINNRASLNRVAPDQNGPKDIEVTINGWRWVFMVERYEANRSFNRERYRIHGESITKLLAAPYAPLRSNSENSPINAKQVVTQQLENTGFTLDWPNEGDFITPDWTFPENTFSYHEQTPMQVIARIATTAGAVVIPSADDDSLTIQPRYPQSPWDWQQGTAITHHIIPESMVISMSAQWKPEPQYNAVYVSGIHAGVSVNVRRQGTAGNDPAPDSYDDWLVDVGLNTERGRNELAKGGNQAVVTLEIPLMLTGEAPGLILPGRLVEVIETGDVWYGLCLSIAIIFTGGVQSKVIQRVGLERHY